ncbi:MULTISPECIES: hypothetical protein [Marispirochaeta]|uniref:hypothetical protein n=1 Tax=Marispirochaeta TaxID=1911565 RepID=UPI0029C7FCAF|nr:MULTISPECIES: hypothetical protein [Marispirochaeta]
MNLEQRHRLSTNLAMIRDDTMTVSRNLSRHFGSDDKKVRKLEKAADLIDDVKTSLTGGRNAQT